ncbi:BtrH N-terminal domain-containing protein [Paenibacillus sp. y28]|uniref:BtrH N-terminal domain-containing protein n=1 Tax=Paenibacillus sp. y28 TaxID=3129110 RepID=UPI0030196449
MNHLVSPDFIARTGYHCLFSGLLHMLKREYPDIAADEADVYLQSDGLNVEFHGDMRTMWLASQEQIARRFADCYGFSADYRFDLLNRGEEALPALRETLADNRLVLLFMRTKQLRYHDIFQDGEERNHIILLYGLDEEAGTAYVADTSFYDVSGQLLSYQGPLPLHNVTAGLWGFARFKPQPGMAPKPEPERFAAACSRIRDFVSGTALDGERYQGMLAYKTYTDAFTGLAELDKEQFSATCKHVYYCLRIGGIMHQIDYLERFVTLHAHRLTRSADLAASWNEKRELWRKTLYQLYKIALSARPEKLAAVQQQCRILLEDQERLLNMLLEDAAVTAAG